MSNKQSSLVRDFYRDIKRLQAPEIDKPRLIKLCRRIKAGDQQARNELVEANLSLAIYFAMRNRWTGLAIEDLVQQCCLALLDAAQKYDPERKRASGFANLCSYYVRIRVQEARAGDAIITTPIYAFREIPQYCAAFDELQATLGRVPDTQEVADKLGWTVNETLRIMAAAGTRRQRRDLPNAEMVDDEHDDEALPSRSKPPDEELADHDPEGNGELSKRHALVSGARMLLDTLDRRQRSIIDLWIAKRTPERIAKILKLKQPEVERVIESFTSRVRHALADAAKSRRAA